MHKLKKYIYLDALLNWTVENELLTSFCLGTASGGQRSSLDRLLTWSSFFLVLLIHLRTFHVLQAPRVNRRQALFKLIHLGLEYDTLASAKTRDDTKIKGRQLDVELDGP